MERGDVRTPGLRWKVSVVLGAALTLPLAIGFTIADFVSFGHTTWDSLAWWLFVWLITSFAFSGWIWEYATWLVVRRPRRRGPGRHEGPTTR